VSLFKDKKTSLYFTRSANSQTSNSSS
jgi:hypothetical protein